jgi:uncharacterized protein YbjT (DUF2867 family)
VARVVAFVPDLLFGSNLVGALQAAGHEPVLAADTDALRRELPGAQVVVVDLTFDAEERTELVRALRPADVRTLAFYSHVEMDVRERAEEAGFDLVVPRSRMARDAGPLVERLLND